SASPEPHELVNLPHGNYTGMLDDEKHNYENRIVTFFLTNLPPSGQKRSTGRDDARQPLTGMDGGSIQQQVDLAIRGCRKQASCLRIEHLGELIQFLQRALP